MGKILDFIGGILVGATAGAAAGLLFSPRSGEEIQQGVRERFQEALAEGRAAQVAKQAELERQAGLEAG